jgi:hypothetical protein
MIGLVILTLSILIINPSIMFHSNFFLYRYKFHFVFIFLFFLNFEVFSQNNGFGNPSLDDFFRRKSLALGIKDNFNLRFLNNYPYLMDSSNYFEGDSITNKIQLDFLPVHTTLQFESRRPYFPGEYGLIPAVGFQSFLSSGIKLKYSFLSIQFKPELIFASNLAFDGFSNNYPENVISSRFYYWNSGDNPERFGNSNYKNFFFGQSYIGIDLNGFEFSFGSRNFWWGPGQWNSLIFSNYAPGFLHFSLNTIKPKKTFLGEFEFQILAGKLESSNYNPTQNNFLNNKYFLPLDPDWRYLNGIFLSYSPKYLNNLSLGYSRTFQTYYFEKPNDFYGWLPILEPFQKEKFYLNNNAVLYDNRRQSQQVAIFARYQFLKSNSELYFQFGRRDHALNWREFILTPEHARAYQFGFLKLFDLPSSGKYFQVRGEITHQQESVNRYLRYGLSGGNSWHTHGRVRGFTNYGQALGVGVGVGSNVQTLEFSLVEDWKKWGILFERIENHQDFYYRAFGQQSERKPWIDWSTALLWNSSWKNLFFTAKVQGVYARNYQWGLSQKSTPEFPVTQNLFSLHSQVNVIYFWDRSLKKEKAD